MPITNTPNPYPTGNKSSDSSPPIALNITECSL